MVKPYSPPSCRHAGQKRVAAAAVETNSSPGADRRQRQAGRPGIARRSGRSWAARNIPTRRSPRAPRPPPRRDRQLRGRGDRRRVGVDLLQRRGVVASTARQNDGRSSSINWRRIARVVPPTSRVAAPMSRVAPLAPSPLPAHLNLVPSCSSSDGAETVGSWRFVPLGNHLTARPRSRDPAAAIPGPGNGASRADRTGGRGNGHCGRATGGPCAATAR